MALILIEIGNDQTITTTLLIQIYRVKWYNILPRGWVDHNNWEQVEINSIFVGVICNAKFQLVSTMLKCRIFHERLLFRDSNLQLQTSVLI